MTKNRNNTPAGRHRKATPPALLFVLLLTVTAIPAAATDVRLVMANDFLSPNQQDDLYTGALEIEFPLGSYRLYLGENIFTDRENERRFDETYLTLERDLDELWGWHSTVRVGVVHVGRGLLGESTQNAIHQLIGDPEVHIPYLAVDRYHPTLGLRLERPIRSFGRITTGLEGEIHNAFDFQGHGALAYGVHWPAWRSVSFDLALGARYSWTRLDALEPRLAELAPTWKAGATLRERVSFTWDYNRFGTESTHFNIGYHMKWGEQKRSRGGLRRLA